MLDSINAYQTYFNKRLKNSVIYSVAFKITKLVSTSGTTKSCHFGK